MSTEIKVNEATGNWTGAFDLPLRPRDEHAPTTKEGEWFTWIFLDGRSRDRRILLGMDRDEDRVAVKIMKEDGLLDPTLEWLDARARDPFFRWAASKIRKATFTHVALPHRRRD